MKVKTMNLDTGGKFIGIINEKDAAGLGVHPLDKIVLKKGSKRVTVTVDTIGVTTASITSKHFVGYFVNKL